MGEVNILNKSLTEKSDRIIITRVNGK